MTQCTRCPARLARQAIRPWRFRCGDDVVTSQVPSSLVTNDSDAMIEALLSGAGIGLITLYRVAPYLRSGRLETVLDELVDWCARHDIERVRDLTGALED